MNKKMKEIDFLTLATKLRFWSINNKFSESRMGPTHGGNLFKYRHTPYGLRGEGSNSLG